MRAKLQRVAALGVVGVMLAACGGSSDDADSGDDTDPTTAPTQPSTIAPPSTDPPDSATTETTEPEAGIDSFDEVQPAVIQILAQGSFRDPEVGTVVGVGRGSGFIIDEDGLAVTNNHVVTGAATLEVFIGGDTSTSYNATVLGVSECNDLALIDIVARDPLPYLEWASGEPTVGTEVYAAGFPLGEQEFTMTRGIVAKAAASGDTPWSSIDAVIEHDANIQQGNSGGPLVGTDGHVLGVNYRGRPWLETVQFFAISSALGRNVVEELRDGDFEALGINGSAVVDDESGISGIWVSGTSPGSPASNAGILSGDIVTSLNGLPMASDGTMKDYCDVIRTAGDRPIAVEILRFDTQEVLSGEINGELPIEQVFSFADEIDDEVDVVDDSTVQYSGIQTIVDDTGSMTVDVPVEWSDVDPAPLDDGSPWIAATTSLASFYEGTFDVPGMFMVASTPLAADEIAGAIEGFAPGQGACTVDEGTAPYEDAAFTGQYRLWAGCGGVGAVNVVIVANANDGSGAVVIGVQLVTDADFDALDTIIATFNFI